VRWPLSPPQVSRLIVGLGNPGREYARTRHNVGFVIADRLAKQANLKFTHRWSQAHVATGSFAGTPIAVAKPQTWMNNSGGSVQGLAKRFDLKAPDIIVVYDDVDLPTGRLRIREGGSSGGHRGVKSIIERLGADGFVRVRIGIGRPDPRDTVDYVLSTFDSEESALIDDAVARALGAIEAILADGLDAAMNKYNR
jgi:peptidyl-tRNA hydrolase, PTH1 family